MAENKGSKVRDCTAHLATALHCMCLKLARNYLVSMNKTNFFLRSLIKRLNNL